MSNPMSLTITITEDHPAWRTVIDALALPAEVPVRERTAEVVVQAPPTAVAPEAPTEEKPKPKVRKPRKPAIDPDNPEMVELRDELRDAVKRAVQMLGDQPVVELFKAKKISGVNKVPDKKLAATIKIVNEAIEAGVQA